MCLADILTAAGTAINIGAMPDQTGERKMTQALEDQTATLVDDADVIEVVDVEGDESKRSTVVVDLRKTLKESRRPRRQARHALTAAEAECLRVIANDVRAVRHAKGLNLSLDRWSDAKVEKFAAALLSLRKRRVLELVTRVQIDRVVVMPGPFEKHVKPLIAAPKARRPKKPASKTKPRRKRTG
jgi:hypothetical protein